jgi:hypothetical protein
VHPDAVSAVKPRTKATINLLLRRDMWCYPRFVQGQSVARESISLPETHVQYDAKEHDHECFREFAGKFLRHFHSNGTVPPRPSGNWYVRSKSTALQHLSNQDRREFRWRNGMRVGSEGNFRPASRVSGTAAASIRRYSPASAPISRGSGIS